MKTTKTQVEKASSRNGGTKRTGDNIARADATIALLRTRMVLLNRCIDLQDICSEMGLPLSRVAEDCKRSIRENVNSIIEGLRSSANGSYVAGLVDYVGDATKDLLYLDQCILDHKVKAENNYEGQIDMASEFRDAAIDSLRAVLNQQIADWDGADVEELRRIRADLSRIGMADTNILGGLYDEATGLEVLGEDKRGRQLVVIVREPEKGRSKSVRLVKTRKRHS